MRLNLKAMDLYLAEKMPIRSSVSVMIMVWLLLLCLVGFVMRLQSRRMWKMGKCPERSMSKFKDVLR